MHKHREGLAFLSAEIKVIRTLYFRQYVHQEKKMQKEKKTLALNVFVRACNLSMFGEFYGLKTDREKLNGKPQTKELIVEEFQHVRTYRNA